MSRADIRKCVAVASIVLASAIADAKTCEGRDSLRAWLEQFATDAPLFVETTSAKLLALPAAMTNRDVDESAPVLVLRLGEMVLDGESLGADVPLLAKKLARLRDTSKLLHWSDAAPSRVFLDVEPVVPWGFVVRAVDAAVKSGYTHAMFRFERKVSTPPPEPSPLDGELSELAKITSPAAKGDALLALWSRIFADCRQANAGFNDVNPHGRTVRVIRGIAAAVTDCYACRVESASVARLVWVTLGGVSVQSVGFDIGAGTRIASAKDAPWSTAAKAVLDAASGGARKVTLAVTAP